MPLDRKPDDESRSTRLAALFKDVVLPVLLPGDGSALSANLPRRALEVLDRVGDIEATGREILDLVAAEAALTGELLRLDQFLKPGDAFTKKDRTIAFQINDRRNLSDPSNGIGLSVEDSFELEFHGMGEIFDDVDVDQRYRSVREGISDLAADSLLAVAVLPQKKTLLGVDTPLKINVLGLPFSLRFGILAAEGEKLRFFAAGPFVKEIPL